MIYYPTIATFSRGIRIGKSLIYLELFFFIENTVIEETINI